MDIALGLEFPPIINHLTDQGLRNLFVRGRCGVCEDKARGFGCARDSGFGCQMVRTSAFIPLSLYPQQEHAFDTNR